MEREGNEKDLSSEHEFFFPYTSILLIDVVLKIWYPKTERHTLI